MWSVKTPSPLAYFASLVAEDEGFPLLEATVAVAMDESPIWTCKPCWAMWTSCWPA